MGLIRNKRRKIGLALSGGAAKGFAHIGVLEVLEEAGVRFDMIAGTSIGALVGAICAQGKNPRDLKDIALQMGKKRLLPLIDLALLRNGFIEGNRLRRFLKDLIGDVSFSDLKVPFACVATDILCGDEVVIKEGSVLDAVRASISLPGIFTIVKWKDRYLVDGGLVNPMPVKVLKDMGAELIIAVDVLPIRGHYTGEYKKMNLVSVLLQSFYIGAHSIAAPAIAAADVVISPHVEDISFTDFHSAPDCIRQGEIAARKALPELRKLLDLPSPRIQIEKQPQ